MKDKKGFTILELMLSMTIVLSVIILLTQIIVMLKNIMVDAGLKTDLAIQQANISNVINQEFRGNELNKIVACGDKCLEFQFKNGNNKKLIVNKTTNTITFGDYAKKLVTDSYFGDPTIIFTNNSNGAQDLKSFFKIDLPIYHNGMEDEFGIKLIYQYDNDNSITTLSKFGT